MLKISVFSSIFIALIVFCTLAIFLQNYNEKNVKTRNAVSRKILQSTNNIENRSLEFIFAPPEVELDDSPPENIPDFYVKKTSQTMPSKFNKTCANFPADLLNLKFQADLWQMLKTSKGVFNLFNAYLDKRDFNKNGALVRILGAYDIRPNENDTFYCQFWYDNSKQPVIVKVDEIVRIWVKGWGGDKDGIINSYLLSCVLPDEEIPISVSLVENPCDNAETNLKIVYNEIEGEKEDFVVCVKGLNFPFSDQTMRLAEWIELLRLLGADKIHFYEFDIHPNVKKLLDYYVVEGFVEITPITLVGGVSNTPYLQNLYLRRKVLQRRLQEVIPYNDCLYKHLYEYKHVVLQDTDEVIIPKTGTWRELIEKTGDFKKTKKTSYMARNVYFLDSFEHQHDWFEDIPEFFHMLQHIHRSANYTGKGAYVKGFHDTDKIITMHNHFPFKCSGGCKHLEFDLELAHLQHYRGDCVKDVKNCADLKKNSVEDARIWNFKYELVDNVLRVLRDLDFLEVKNKGKT